LNRFALACLPGKGVQEDAAMPSPGDIIRLWYEEVWNQRDDAKIPDYLAPDGVIHALDIDGQNAQGPDAFRAFQQQMLQSFPDLHFTVHDVIENGDWAAGRWSAEATHSGDGFGVSATGECVKVTGMSMVRASGGRIVEAWNEWDRIGLATTCRMVTPAQR
jgi:predicted ester cyclase